MKHFQNSWVQALGTLGAIAMLTLFLGLLGSGEWTMDGAVGSAPGGSGAGISSGNVDSSAFVVAGSKLWMKSGGTQTGTVFRGTITFPTSQKMDTVTVSNLISITSADGSTNFNLNNINGVLTLTGPSLLAFTIDRASNNIAFGLPILGNGAGLSNVTASASNALSRVSTNGTLVSGSVTQLDIVGPFILSNSSGRITLTAPAIVTNGASPTFNGVTSTGSVNRMTFTGTNGLNTEMASDNATSDNLTNFVGLYYFPSGGTNQADFGRFNQFILTNNLQTNLTMWLTNGAPGRMGRIKILGSTNGNNYTVTLLSAQAWLMEWDRNNPTNGATTLTVTNNQSVEFSVVFDKTPTNPIASLVYSRKTL